MWQEAEAPQRAFLEAWVYLAHFTWFPDSEAFKRWRDKPDQPVEGQQFRLKPQVEQELSERLDLSLAKKFPVGELFRVFSNISLHPTRFAAERCWEEAARKRRVDRGDPEIQMLSDLFGKLGSMTKTIVFVVQMHLFLQFLRNYLLREPLVPARHASPERALVEHLMESWLSGAEYFIKFAYRVAGDGFVRPRGGGAS